ncbi:MAG: two-component regulator propeller domain-containing protein [Bacteroidota bacterium]
MTLFNYQIFKPFCFIYLVIIILLFSQEKTQAQILSENTKFKHLSVNDGLSDNYVHAIFQDREGFMWFGTGDGLNKYDGYKFTIYRHNPNDTNSFGAGTMVYCIYEDKEGLIWIGSEGSLSVFNKKDGKFKVYKNDPQNPNSISHNIITAINEDKEGIMWISTYGGGLNKLDKKTGNFFAYRNDPKDPNSISSDFVENFIEDPKGVFWIATFEGGKGGLNSFDKNSKKFTYYSLGNSVQLLFHIVEDTNGIIWMGTAGEGLIAFDKEKKTVIKQYLNAPKDRHSLSQNTVFFPFEDSQGYLWAGSIHGINVMDKQSGKFTVLKNDPGSSYSLSNNYITTIYEDNQGLIWIGTGGGGVNIYDRNNNNFIIYKNNSKNEKSLTNNMVYSIYEDSKGSMWMGTGKGGLTNFNRTTGEFNHLKGETMIGGKKTSIPLIGSIQETDDQQLWIGPPSYMVFGFDRSTHKYNILPTLTNEKDAIEAPGFIFGLLADSKKTLWAASPQGLFNLKIPEKKVISYKNDPDNPNSISENYVFNLFEDSQNNIWISTRSTGLNVFERATGKFYCFKNDPKDPNSINNNVVNTIYQAPNGVLWIGTNGGGLNALILQNGKNKFTSGYKFYHFTDKDGLPNNVITGILPDDDGSLWIATNQGLCQFYASNYLALTVKEYLTKAIADIQKKDIVKKDIAIFKNYDINDGLPSNSFTGAMCKTKDGKMYMGSSDGLLSFLPSTIKNNTHKPPVYFTSFKIFEKEFPLDTPIATKRELVLSYKQSFFSFEFVALDYAQSSKNQYAFMMEGFDDKWIDVGNRRYASYTNLDPGEYIFRVKASNNNGVWNEEGASIRIIITPPFWRTNIFYILCVLVASMIIFGYIKWRERKLNKEKRILEDQVTMRTKELTEANSEIVQKNHEITDSINYAKRIQQAILPDKNEIYSVLPQSFVLYKPKDIVSGDFYFFSLPPASSPAGAKNKIAEVFIAAADCTGHGVPGAFMSMIGSEKLHDAVQQSKIPGEILMLINKGIKTTLHQSQNDNSTRDGMDIAFCTLDLQNNKVLYSGANRPFLLIRKDSSEIEEIKATKNAIGGFTENEQPFETHEIQLKPGDTFYIFTDGYADQFGGEKGKKFTTKKFKKLLIDIQNKSMQEQETLLSNVMDAWSLNTEQVDDILIIGIRI